MATWLFLVAILSLVSLFHFIFQPCVQTNYGQDISRGIQSRLKLGWGGTRWGLGAFYTSTVGIFQDQDEQRQILGWVGDVKIKKLKHLGMHLGKILELGKLKIILILLDFQVKSDAVILAL